MNRLLKSRALRYSAIALLSVAALSGCKVEKKDEAKSAGPAGGPPPLPPYQMRAQIASGDRLNSTDSGDALFSNHCGACHLAMGMGTNLLTKQQVMAGQPPEKGLLANRDDLTADYVKSVVRMGKGAMPRQTRVDITDSELEKVAAYLGKSK
jgi:mono/diheme cytochrome c family protein